MDGMGPARTAGQAGVEPRLLEFPHHVPHRLVRATQHLRDMRCPFPAIARQQDLAAPHLIQVPGAQSDDESLSFLLSQLSHQHWWSHTHRPARSGPFPTCYPAPALGGRGGNTSLKDAAAMEHLPKLLTLARYPNVAVKATGAPGYSSGPYPFTSMHPYLEQIFDAFGPDRMFWGTDITKMPCPWRQCVTMFSEELPWLGLYFAHGRQSCRY